MKTVGILGGMGSMATVDLFSKIVTHTKVTCDQDHLHILIDNYSEIPDRTDYIINKKNNPLVKMIEGAKRLEKAGADFLAMPCNTAHYFYDALKSAIGIPIVHMMTETSKQTKSYKKTVLLATQGTYLSDLYKDVLYPNDMVMSMVSKLIYEFKEKGYLNTTIKADVLEFLDSADSIILGCTELPLIFNQDDTDIVLIDPTTILAKAIIKKAGGHIK